MKKLIPYLFTFLAYNSASALCTDIEGQWVMQQEVNGVVIDTTLTVTEDTTEVSNVCSHADKKSTSQVKAKSSYTDFTLTILETKQNKVTGDLDCQSELKAETFSYSMVGNMLLLTQASGTQLVLVRK